MSSDKNIFQSTAHLTHEQMLNYLHHNVSKEQRHTVEKHLVDCSFCSEAMEGLKKMDSDVRILTITDDLRRMVRKRKVLRRKVFTQLDLIALSLIIFLIVFLIIVAVVMFWKK